MSRFCHECGAANAADARFCEACGVPLRPLPGAVSPAPIPLLSPESPPSSSVPRKRLSGKTWAAIVGAVVLVVSAGGAGIWFGTAAPVEAAQSKGWSDALTAAFRSSNLDGTWEPEAARSAAERRRSRLLIHATDIDVGGEPMKLIATANRDIYRVEIPNSDAMFGVTLKRVDATTLELHADSTSERYRKVN